MAAPRLTAASAPKTGGWRVLATLAVLAAALSVFSATGSKAHAHAAFLESVPAPGARAERSPREVILEFTEPLNANLTRVTLLDADSDAPVEAEARVEGRSQMLVRPAEKLTRGAYRIDWYTVSTLDGHPLEGSFGFGVRAPAASAEQVIEQSPLAGRGWLRILARGVLYGALFFFAGGLFAAVLLSRDREPAEWLYPATVAAHSRAPASEAMRRKAWRATLRIGWVAAAAATAVALVETYDASGGLGVTPIADYLLTNAAGIARLVTVAAIAAAAILAPRARGTAAAAVVLALLAIAFSGHANSAEPRTLAIASDWTHLVAGCIWVGGIAQLAAAWVPGIRRVAPETRREAMRSVLARFGRIALPAFAIVAVSGLVNAAIQLGEVSALWETPYGRVLAVKIGLVGMIALASYGHGIRMRPRLLAQNPHPEGARERRHWRLISVEPVLGGVVVLSAAALVAFPLPPRQLAETETEVSQAACEPACPVPEPMPRELAVAEPVSSHVAAVWLRPNGQATVRVYDREGSSVNVTPSLGGGELAGSCGEGCWRARVPDSSAELRVAIRERSEQWRAVVPVRWNPSRTADARQLIARAQREMRGLARVRIRERTSSGPGVANATVARLRSPEHRRLMRANFRWMPFADSARWLGTAPVGGRRVVRVAVLDPGTPTWYRLAIDPTSGRVLRERLVLRKHFIDRRYSRFAP